MPAFFPDIIVNPQQFQQFSVKPMIAPEQKYQFYGFNTLEFLLGMYAI